MFVKQPQSGQTYSLRKPLIVWPFKMWEVDPETRSKLYQVQKKEGSGNDKCCDCGAPSPQWASPKFSTFICLSCAGTHRSLGVHISFVRSISMDAFKQNEILRMQHGGNKAWQDFYNCHIDGENGRKSFENSSIKERYESDVGDEWKERLSAKVEERDFDREVWQREREEYKAKVAAKAAGGRTQAPLAGGPRIGGGGITTAGRSEPPPSSDRSNLPASQKEKSETYFSKLGAANASRPENLPPSQGGRYTGFGSSLPATGTSSTDPSKQSIPTQQEFQSDPVAALTKSFGWFTTSLTSTAKSVTDTYILPTAKNITSSEFASQARAAALQAGTGLQSTAKSASESFNRFVEGQHEGQHATSPTAPRATRSGAGAGAGATSSTVEPERKDFWDSFGEPSLTETVAASMPSSSIGTAAMKKGGSTGAGTQ